MKLDIPVPYEKLAWFQEKLGLGEEALRELNRHQDLFLGKKDEFAECLFSYFCEIAETRAILNHEKRARELKRVWAFWYGLLFKGSFTPEILAHLWRSGLRHVEINLDKRFINLAYAFVRQFLQDIAKTAVPAAEHQALLAAFDRMIDFCLLIETHAYVTATSQCDMEVVKGISHQVRNPLTVIGGNIVRLQRKAEPGSPLYKTYEMILMENQRLENMVRDAGVYSELFQVEPLLSEVSLEKVLSQALRELEAMPEKKTARIEMNLDPRIPCTQGDPHALQTMFFYLLQNSLEAMDPQNPLVRVSSGVLGTESTVLQIEIFNTGRSPSPEELTNVFVPFYSTKPYGTGFGLPIAQVVARKSLGDVLLEPVPGEGTRCIVRLPTGHALQKNYQAH